jgi:hypothetical protein
MGRPTTGPLGTLPVGMREAIVQMRRTHPGWGPTTLLAELRVDPGFADRHLPSRSRIAALLSAEKLTRRYQKHSELPPQQSRRKVPRMTSGNSMRKGACMWRAWAKSV